MQTWNAMIQGWDMKPCRHNEQSSEDYKRHGLTHHKETCLSFVTSLDRILLNGLGVHMCTSTVFVFPFHNTIM